LADNPVDSDNPVSSLSQRRLTFSVLTSNRLG
jgi:hypothetical protein